MPVSPKLLNVKQDIDARLHDLQVTGTFEGGTLNVDTIQFDITHTGNGEQPGELFWNTVDGTLDIELLNGTRLQVGQELHFYAKASGAIGNGELCQFAGVQGDHILAKKAVAADIIANPEYIIGIATQAIVNNQFGYITWIGKVNNVATPGWSAGDVLWFDKVTGQLTNIMPTPPDVLISVAAVIKTATGAAENGVLLVRPTIYPPVTATGSLTITGALAHTGNTAGFYGTTPITRPVLPTGSTADEIITTLQALGLVSQT